MKHRIAAAVAVIAVTGTTVTASDAGTLVTPDQAEPRGACDLPGPYDYPHGSQRVDLDPADFTTRIDHPYFPMRPGTVRIYREIEGREVLRVRVTVTHRTRVIDGIRTRVVHDVVRDHGQLVENTFDWYAQDAGGSIWYLGEATRSYEDGEVVSTEGSWEHGRDGAQAGVLLSARPEPGCAYREEYRDGVAEDRAVVLARRERLTTRLGTYRRVLHTANHTPLEPEVLENKFYARGVGPVVEIDVSPAFSTAVLVRISRS